MRILYLSNEDVRKEGTGKTHFIEEKKDGFKSCRLLFSYLCLFATKSDSVAHCLDDKRCDAGPYTALDYQSNGRIL